MDLFFIRHGESFNNALTDVSQRVADPPLTERGQQQADRLGAFVATGGHLDQRERESGPRFHQVYCSPMLRTLQTARPVSEALGLPSQLWVDVHEVGGIWVDGIDHSPGMGRGQIEAQFPGAILADEITDEEWWTGGQETAAQGRGRAIAVAASLRERARDASLAGESRQRIAVVSHGDFMSAVVKALTDHLPSWGIFYEHNNTAITRFRLDPEMCSVRYLNRIDHLDDSQLLSL